MGVYNKDHIDFCLVKTIENKKIPIIMISRHVGLIVNDIENLLIYRDVLEFIPKLDQIESGTFYEHLTGIQDGIARTCKCYAKDGSCIELIEYQSHESEKRNKGLLTDGFNHIAINIDNLDKKYQQLKKINVRFINKPKINNQKLLKLPFVMIMKTTCWSLLKHYFKMNKIAFVQEDLLVKLKIRYRFSQR